jgi:ATP-binding cassette subfamily G (WHITE) protein 2 (SNQ2)
LLILYSSTRGLDASTALEFVRALRIANNVFRTSTIVSIYQAGESLYELFDKVCVIYEGKMAYFGRADQARRYFVEMGYEPAPRQTTADFLVAVTDAKGRMVRADVDPRSVPKTKDEFEAWFGKSEAGKVNREDMESFKEECMGRPERVDAYKQSALAEHAKHVRKESPHTVSVPMQVRAVMVRRVQIMKGNFTAQAIQAA